MKPRPTLTLKHASLLSGSPNPNPERPYCGAATGATASTVYILAFHKGKPILVAQSSTVGGVSYREEHSTKGDYVIVSVPPKVYPGGNGKFPDVPPRQYRIRTDE